MTRSRDISPDTTRGRGIMDLSTYLPLIWRRSKAAPAGWARAARLGAFGLTALLLLVAVAVWRVRFAAFDAAGAVAIDYRTFVDFGHRLLTDGTAILPYQLAGPYQAAPEVPRLDPATVPFLYPPAFAFVGVALTVLPAFLWWAVPIALLAWCVASWRPAPWAWPLMALALAWPNTSAVVIVGGSTMWAAALVAAGLRWRWPAALLLLKPTMLPFALVGVRDRRWWVVAAVLAVVSLPRAGEYVTAMRNTTDLRWWYSLGDLPLLLLPVVAWLSRAGAPGGSASAP